MAPRENYRLAFPPDPKPYISSGLPFPEACANHIQNTLHVSKVYIIVSNSISKTQNFSDLRDALGDKVVGFRRGIRPHTPWDDVLEIILECKKLDADCIVTLGAGSLTDGAKIVSFGLGNDISTLDSFATLANDAKTNNLKQCKIPIINIPTSLSGAEFQSMAGATDMRDHHKALFYHPSMGAQIVILSPVLTTSTPEGVWLSSGVRGIDHCVEGAGSLDEKATDETEKQCLKALAMLVPSLLVTKHSGEDEDARMSSMLAVVEAMKVVKAGLPMGASHGIGHQLGPLNVGHGVTSCVMLPPVMKYNFQHGDERVRGKQQSILNTLWAEQTVAEVLEKWGLQKKRADLGDVLDAIVRELGQPRSLTDVGIEWGQLEALADNCLKDVWLKTNPVPLVDKSQVLEILEMAFVDKKSLL